MAKTEFLQIRLSPEERERIWAAAAADHLEPSTWARRALLLALDRAEDVASEKRQAVPK
jgi:uncharacterized protein (DUF1778 family)